MLCVAAKAPDAQVQILSAIPQPRDLGQHTDLLYKVGVMVKVRAPSGWREGN